MNYVYMPLFYKDNEIKWTIGLNEILETLYPSDASVKIIPNEMMKELANGAPRLCFRHIVFLLFLMIIRR